MTFEKKLSEKEKNQVEDVDSHHLRAIIQGRKPTQEYLTRAKLGIGI